MPRKPPRSTEERLVRWQRSAAPGTLGGRVASAAPMALDVTRLDPRMRATRPTPRLHTYTRVGIVAAGAATVPLYNDSGSMRQILSVRTALGAAPATTSVIVNVDVAGSDIFSSGSEPHVNVGTTVGHAVNPDVTSAWPAGAALYVNVIQGDADATDLHVTIAVA